LKKEEYTFGKDSGCSYVIKDSELGKADYDKLSKKQFKIVKKKDGVYLEDLAVTYVNTKEVGSKQKILLNHNATIAIIKMHLKVFVYLDKSVCDAKGSDLPKQLGDKYLMSSHLGEGGFGEVSLVFEKDTGKRFAMKMMKKNPKLMKYAHTETTILQKIKHPCLIETEEVVDSLNVLFIVLEFMEGGDLSKRIHPIRKMQEADMKLIFFQIVNAIQYLHGQKIVHRDIKPENILLASKNTETLIKVTDFGVSKILRPGTVMDTRVGTPVYMAPEIHKNVSQYTKEVDIWSMGVLLYYCLTCRIPFRRIEDIRFGTDTFPAHYWSGMTPAVVTLIKGMLKVQPTQRISIEDILNHAWLKDPIIRRKAHNLMWPGKPYVEEKPAPAPVGFQRGGSMRLQRPRGVMQFMSMRSSRQQVAAEPNRMPAYPLRQPAGNADKVLAESAEKLKIGAARLPAGNAARLPLGSADRLPIARQPAGNAAKLPAGSAERLQIGNAAKLPAGNAAKLPAGSAERLPIGNAAKLPAGNANRLSVGNAARLPAGSANKLPVANAARLPVGNVVRVPSASTARPLQHRGVVHEFQKPVKDVIKNFDK
ncbi:hypothetical protein ANN_00335, partial [Periplaneta americana]